MAVQLSVDSLCWNTAGEVSWLPASIRGASACLQSPGRWGELEPAVGLPCLTAAKRAGSSQEQSALECQLDPLRARRKGGGAQGKVAHQPQSTTEEQPGHQAALPVPQPHKDGCSSQGADLPSSRLMRRRRSTGVLQADKPREPPDSEAG